MPGFLTGVGAFAEGLAGGIEQGQRLRLLREAQDRAQGHAAIQTLGTVLSQPLANRKLLAGLAVKQNIIPKDYGDLIARATDEQAAAIARQVEILHAQNPNISASMLSDLLQNTPSALVATELFKLHESQRQERQFQSILEGAFGRMESGSTGQIFAPAGPPIEPGSRQELEATFGGATSPLTPAAPLAQAAPGLGFAPRFSFSQQGGASVALEPKVPIKTDYGDRIEFSDPVTGRIIRIVPKAMPPGGQEKIDILQGRFGLAEQGKALAEAGLNLKSQALELQRLKAEMESRQTLGPPTKDQQDTANRTLQGIEENFRALNPKPPGIADKDYEQQIKDAVISAGRAQGINVISASQRVGFAGLTRATGFSKGKYDYGIGPTTKTTERLLPGSQPKQSGAEQPPAANTAAEYLKKFK